MGVLGVILISDFTYAIFGKDFFSDRCMIKRKYGISLERLIILLYYLVGDENLLFRASATREFETMFSISKELKELKKFDKFEETKALFRVLKSNGINPTDNLIALFNEAKEFEGAAIIMQAAHDVYGHKDPEDIDLL